MSLSSLHSYVSLSCKPAIDWILYKHVLEELSYIETFDFPLPFIFFFQKVFLEPEVSHTSLAPDKRVDFGKISLKANAGLQDSVSAVIVFIVRG